VGWFNWRRRDWRKTSLAGVPDVPRMTHPDELRYFAWCCAELHRRGRRVVELGPFIGGSTVAMASGLKQSRDPRGQLVTIDWFRWEEWAIGCYAQNAINGLSERQRAKLGPRDLAPQVGGSFLPIFRAYTEPFAGAIETIDADLAIHEWTGEPIDVLMIDAAKSWPVFDQIVRQFFPALVNGAAVIHQDYKHWYCYWLHVVTERMIERGVLTFAENVNEQSTQGFRFRGGEFQPAEYIQAAFDEPECDRLLRQAIDRYTSPTERLAITSAYIRFLREHGRNDRARAVFAGAIAAGPYAECVFLHDFLARNPAEWARSAA
jgi:hypothetical protein